MERLFVNIGRGNKRDPPLSKWEIRCQLGEIRCQFIILTRKDDLSPDYARKDDLSPDYARKPSKIARVETRI